MKSKTIVFIFSLFIISSEIGAQDFKSAVGGRLGWPLGITYKTFINETDAIDVSAGFSGIGIGASGALLVQYQRHQDLEIAEIDRIQFFYGAGVSGQVWRSRFFNTGGLYLGGHATGGISYTFEDMPLNVSFEVNPGLFVGFNEFYNNGIFFSYYTGLCARYILSE